jgi:glyoxylase-like metal-dependent hydrolase (beta-lactamase superfamily II)
MKKRPNVLPAIILIALSTLSARAAEEPAGRATIVAAAQALGGLDRVRAVKNISLIGYAIYAYQFGGGGVTASPNAALRFMAANDVRRVFDFQQDFEHDRFQQTEFRNMLFTFARAAPTQWQPFNLVLDGDIAYNIDEKGVATRAPRWVQTAWHVDGVHMRRMWMLNNPVALIRAALDPGTTISNEHTEPGLMGELRVLDLRLRWGDKLTVAFSQRTHLPTWVRWNNPHDTLGELTFTTYLEGYVPYADGLLLPLSYNTRIDWRNIDELRVYVDGYIIDGKIADLAAPQAVRDAPEPVPHAGEIVTTHIAPHIWYLRCDGQSTTVFEFADHLTLFELNNKLAAKKIIDYAKTLVPGKVPTAVITSHAHPDHVDGVRVAIAEGLAVISRRENELIIRDMATHPAPDYPDELALHPKPLKFIPVDDHLRLSDPTMTVDVYWARTNSHMADGLFAYAPEQKVMAEADIATAAFDYQFWADDYMDNIDYYKLDVEELLPVHFPPMKQTEVIEFIKAGVERARQRCALEEQRGTHYVGCPVLTKRY